MTERRFRVGPVVIALRAEGRAVDRFCASLLPFSTSEDADGIITFTSRADADGAQTVPLPRVEGSNVIGQNLRAELSTGRLRVTRAEGTGEVANAFRWLLAELLLDKHAVLIHGCGVISGGAAALFTGKSGAGKSTLARASESGGLTVLGDELVVVADAKEPVASGTPWNTGNRAEGALRIFGTLAWAKQPGLAAISGSEVLRTATDNVLLPRTDPSTRARVASVLLKVIGKVRTARLSFAPEPTAGAFLKAELG